MGRVDRLPKLDASEISPDLLDCLTDTITAARPYWKSLKCWSSAPNHNSTTSDLAEFLGINTIPGGAERLYAVAPLPFCPHLAQICPIPAGVSVDVQSSCSGCGHIGENWLCLTCYHVSFLFPITWPLWDLLLPLQISCSRFVHGHGQDHSEKTGHSMALSFADLSAWCYACDSYVHHSAIGEAKRAAHNSKFGVELPSGSF